MTIKQLVGAYLALMLLLAATVAIHTLHLGVWNAVLNLTIAAIKAVLIALLFMRLWHDTNLVRVFSLIGLAWLALLFILSLADYLHRAHPQDFYGAGAAPQRLERSLLGS